MHVDVVVECLNVRHVWKNMGHLLRWMMSWFSPAELAFADVAVVVENVDDDGDDGVEIRHVNPHDEVKSHHWMLLHDEVPK